MASDQTTRIPHVPIRTPLFDADGNLTRTWMIFFERLGGVTSGGSGAARPFHRTLLVKDTAIGPDIADHVTAYASGTATRIVGVLRAAISSDLTLHVQLNGSDLIVLTIPAATAVDTPVESTDFEVTEINDGDVFSWDISASDGSTANAGIASFTVEWS